MNSNKALHSHETTESKMFGRHRHNRRVGRDKRRSFSLASSRIICFLCDTESMIMYSRMRSRCHTILRWSATSFFLNLAVLKVTSINSQLNSSIVVTKSSSSRMHTRDEQGSGISLMV